MKGNLQNTLTGKLTPRQLKSVVKSYDIVGDIAIIRVPQLLTHHSRIVADAIMQTHKRVKTVLQQVSAVSGGFRLRKLKWIAGENKTETTYKEFKCIAQVDLKTCYFSPRLSYERLRIAQQVQPREVVVNMFAGVGCYSILIAKVSRAKMIYSIDINPSAVKYMHKNRWLNRVQDRIVPIHGDAKEVITQKLQNVADRVLMPLPAKAFEYLEPAITSLKPGRGWLHYYDFEHASQNEDPVEKIEAKISRKLHALNIDLTSVAGKVVRETGPNWYQVVLDLQLRKEGMDDDYGALTNSY